MPPPFRRAGGFSARRGLLARRASLTPRPPAPYLARQPMRPPMAASFDRPWRRFGATEAQWHDWRWQEQSSLRTEEQLERHLRLTEEERAGLRADRRQFPVGVTPYYLSLADPQDPWR